MMAVDAEGEFPLLLHYSHPRHLWEGKTPAHMSANIITSTMRYINSNILKPSLHALFFPQCSDIMAWFLWDKWFLLAPFWGT